MFGKQDILGNLYEQTYERIMYGGAMQEIEKSMFCESNMDILCRRCESAREFDEDCWKNFCLGGKYQK